MTFSISAAPNIVYAIPKCASTVKAMPESHHGCSRQTGASQSVRPQRHSAGTAEGDCSPRRSWVSGEAAGLAWHSSCTAAETHTSDMSSDHVSSCYVLYLEP